jgi:ornithine cyclodeaminase/alanine dehydrogenase-like protein (mu-crystallin family)
MTGPFLRLRHSDVLRTLEEIDLLEVVAQELVGRLHGPDHLQTSRFVPSEARDSEELTAVEDLDTGLVCVLPAATLRMVRAAALAGLAARELHPPGVVTAALFGSSAEVQLHLSVLARHVRTLSHAAMCMDRAELPIEQGLRDQLELAGIGLSSTTDPKRAAFGANLLIIASTGGGIPDVGQLHPGTLVVNASGGDLPAELLAGFDQVYVDDFGLLADNQHRTVVRLHLAGPSHRTELLGQHREGWHRHQAHWRNQRRIEADLGRVLTGANGRTHVDDILLVELLGEGALDVAVAGRVQQTAVKHGHGGWVNAAEKE